MRKRNPYNQTNEGNMSPSAVTFGSIRTLIIFSVTFYLCVMLYFHSRLSTEDVRISRLERLASDRMPSTKVVQLSNGAYVDSGGIHKAKRGGVASISRNDLIAQSDSKNVNFLRSKRKRKGPPTAKSRSRNKSRIRNRSRTNSRSEQHVQARQGRNSPQRNSRHDIFKPIKTTVLTKTKHNIFNIGEIKGSSDKLKRDGHLLRVIRGKSATSTTKANYRLMAALRSNELHLKKNNDIDKQYKPYLGEKMSLHNYPRSGRDFLEVLPNVFVYTAYMDVRIGRYLRFISIAYRDEEDRTEQFICRFQGGRYSVGKFYRTCEDHMQLYAAYVISCPVPKTENTRDIFQNGVMISNTSTSSGGYVKVKVVSNIPKSPKKQFNVCVPPLYGNVTADKIIEFVEMNKLLGANHFTFYRENSANHTHFINVLDRYAHDGDATVISWGLPINNDDIWYHGQSVSVWDCLFRNMYDFNYIAFQDIDEFIVPKAVKTWKAMIDSLLKGRKDGDRIAAFRFKSADFDNGEKTIPKFSKSIQSLMTLHTIWRDKRINAARTKLMVDPLKVFELGIHHLSKPISDQFITLDIDSKYALLHHYRKCQEEKRSNCKEFVQDIALWRFHPDIVNNVRKVREKLRLN